MSKVDTYWMQQALCLAERAEQLNEVPVGAIVVLDDVVIGTGYNQIITTCDPTAHAEVLALRNAAKTLNNYRLLNATLYVTLEPCSMCAGSMVHSRIGRLVYGACEPKAGVVASRGEFFKQDFLNHRVATLGGVCAEQSASILSNFFARRREEKKNQRRSG